MRIQTKFILALLLITLLPVFPLYYLIKNFHESSVEVGLNPQVENALEAATNLSQLLYSEYKNDVLELAKKYAASEEVQKAFIRAGMKKLQPISIPNHFASLEILAVDRMGNAVAELRASLSGLTPQLNLGEIDGFLKNRSAQIMPPGKSPEKISAIAPVLKNGDVPGIVIVTAQVDTGFVSSSQRVVEVNQMFKTINLLKDDLQQSFISAFFIVYVPIAALSLVAGYFFSRRITAPLKNLVEGTQKVAAGDWEYRVTHTSGDELGKLVDSFNTMVGEVKTKQDEVIRLEKMAVWREMARVLAHEIKNPLTPIQLTVQQLQDKYTNENPDYKKLLDECTEIINDEIQNLQHLVREFSDFARMPKLHLTRGDLNEMIEETSRLYTDITISTELESNLPEINLDFEKIRRALINFFDNSRHSIREKGGGEITIRTSRKNGFVLLLFADTGNGIPETLRTRIFEPSFSTKKSGMGLGLAIVKRIIEEHGGSITFESKVGEGTTFEIRLPVG
ncbi:MAG: ATP-binding protein [bacterium]